MRHINWLPPIHILTGHQTCKPGMSPDWESNQQPFGFWDDAQPTEPHWLGPLTGFRCDVKKGYHNYLTKLLKYTFLFQLHICGRPDFLHILQSNNITKQTKWRSKYENSINSNSIKADIGFLKM